MSRESRTDRPLAAMGILVGILTGLAVAYMYLTRPQPQPRVTHTVKTMPAASGARVSVPVATRTGPIIGARERSIGARLDSFEPDAEPLRGPLSITADNVVWVEDGGARVARVETLTASFDTDALRGGSIIFDDVRLVRPVATLRQDASGTWNFERLIADDGTSALNGDPVSLPRRTILLRDVEIEDGTVDVTRPGEQFTFRTIDAAISLASLSEPDVPEPYVRVARLSTQFVQREPQAQLDIDITDGWFAFPSGSVRFDIADALLDDTRLADLNGEWDPAAPGYGVTATGRAIDVDFADIAFLLPPELPDTGTASFSFEVEPEALDRTRLALMDLDVASGTSHVTGSITMLLGGAQFELIDADLVADPVDLELIAAFTGPLPYGGTIAGTITGAGRDISFDLDANLTAEMVPAPFDAGITGRVRFTDDGVALERLEISLSDAPLAAVRAVAPGLPLEGSVSGVIALTGTPDRAPLDIDVRLELETGVALVEGSIDLTRDVPSYDLGGQLLGFRVDAIITPEVPPVALNASFGLRGSGFDAATMDAVVQLDGRFTGWEAGPQDTVVVRAAVRGGRLEIDELRGSLAGAVVDASGTWTFVEPQQGSIAYTLDVASLRPFGPWIPVIGDSIAEGSVTTTGTVSGTLDRMRVIGVAEGGGLVVGEWRTGGLAGDYDVTMGGGRLPEMIVNAELRDIVTPTAGEYTDGTLAIELMPPALNAQFEARRTDGGFVDVVASGDLPESGQRRIVLEKARFDMAEDQWRLERPATFTWVEGSPVHVADLMIVSERGGRITIDGYVLPLADVDARVDIAGLPVGDVQRLLGREPRVEGLLQATGTVRGGETDTSVDLVFRVDQGAINGIDLQSIDGSLVYANGQTVFEAQVVVDESGRLDINAQLPSYLRIGGTPMFELIDGAPLEGLIVADHFSLESLTAVFPQIQSMSGYADMRVTLSGTADAPVVAGELTAASDQFRVLPLNQTFTESTVHATFDGRRLVIDQARTRSDGWMNIGGQVVFERLTEPVLDLTLDFDGFEPMGVDDHPDGAITGQVTLKGPLDGLVLTGEVETHDGYIEVPELGGPSIRSDLVDLTRPASRDTLEFDTEPRTDIFHNLRIEDLVVNVASDTWFDAYRAQIQLSGRLVVNKVGETLPITGTLTGDRGQYTLIAGPVVRRFQVVSAEVQFRGEPSPNPTIDITVRRIVLDEGGRQTDVDVRITGTADNPSLQLAGGTPGQVAESDLLSLLLFGTPSSTLAGDELPGDVLLSQTYGSAFWEIVSLELERSLGGLGLDIFQIRVGQGAFGLASPTIVAGRQIQSDVFLSLEVALNGLFDEVDAGVTTWSIRLDWMIDRRTQLRLAYEPVYRGRGLRSSAFVLPQGEPRQQLLTELRRRWTY